MCCTVIKLHGRKGSGIVMENVLHIAAHLGGGAGKAISGLAIGMQEYFNNKILLLEEPENMHYVNVCNQQKIEVTVSSDLDIIKSMVADVDYVVFSWWGHPLSVEVFNALSEVKSRVFLWSHINGLYYPVMTGKFIAMFDGAMFTSKCSYENSHWTEEERQQIVESTKLIYGIGDFKPVDVKHKSSYDVDKSFNIGYAGTVNYNKMNENFPEICSRIKREIPNAEFYFYGKYEEDIYLSFVDYDRCLGESIHFEGYVDNLQECLTNLDVFCYPLTSHNFATTENALLEAMAAGLPAVVLNNSPERNIIEHNYNGLIANNVEEMVANVVVLYNDRELAENIGSNARKYTIDNYDSCANAKKCAEYIKSFADKEKDKHNFVDEIGSMAGDYFLFFANMNLEEYKKRYLTLDEIFYGNTKGSVVHYKKYYSDEILEELTEI